MLADFRYTVPKAKWDALIELHRRSGDTFTETAGNAPTVWREMLLFLAKIEDAEAVKPTFYALAKKYDGQDIFYRAALNIACGNDPERRDKILADFDKHFPEWDDKTADLVWELRPKSVLPRLGKLLGDPKLTAMQKARVIDIIASNDDPAAGKSMLDVLQSDAAPEVKARAINSLKLFLPTKWKGLQSGKELAAVLDGLLKDAKSQATGLQLVAAVGAVNRVDAVAAIAKDTNAPLDIRKEAVRTLGKLPDQKSVDALVNIGSPKNDLSLACISALRPRSRRRPLNRCNWRSRSKARPRNCARPPSRLSPGIRPAHSGSSTFTRRANCRRNSWRKPAGCSATRRSRACGTRRCSCSRRRAS
jgi:hypothetical protein